MMTTSRLISGMLGRSLVLENFESCKTSRRSHDAASGMGGRSAHIKVLNRCTEARVARCRTQEEKLLKRKLALEDVAFAQSPLAFEIERRHHLAMQDDVFDVGRVLGNGVDDSIAKCFFLVVPIQAGSQFVGRV